MLKETWTPSSFKLPVIDGLSVSLIEFDGEEANTAELMVTGEP